MECKNKKKNYPGKNHKKIFTKTKIETKMERKSFQRIFVLKDFCSKDFS